MRIIQMLALVIAGFLATAVSSPVLAQTVHATLEGFHEVPAVSSAARGQFRAKIANDSITYELSYDGLEGDVRQAHIHFGQTGASGGISIWLCQTTTNVDPTGLSPDCPQSGTVTGTITAANVVGPSGQGIAGGPTGATASEFAEIVDAIRSGVTYANVHSSKFPSGEIRGQIGSVNRRSNKRN